MTKEEFQHMLRNEAEVACQNAESKLGTKISRDLLFKLYGTGVGGKYVGFDELLDRTFLSENVFYRLIDLMVVEILGQRPVIFTRVSGHAPGPLSECWNGMRGPFKQLIADDIAQRHPPEGLGE